MKRIFITLLAALFITVLIPAPSLAQTYRNDTFCWVVTGNAATVTSYHGNGGNVVIPAELSRLPVTDIATCIFKNRKDITSVSIPDTVTDLGTYAFAGCENLESVKLPKNLQSIKLGTFEGCKNLSSIALPDSLKEIGESAFKGCELLTGLKLPAGLTALGEMAFYGCSSLTEISVPGSVSIISDQLFEGCFELKKVTLNKGTTEISAKLAMYSPFYRCPKLAEIYVPQTLKTLYAAALEPLNRNAVIHCAQGSAAYNAAVSLKLKTSDDQPPVETDQPTPSNTTQPAPSVSTSPAPSEPVQLAPSEPTPSAPNETTQPAPSETTQPAPSEPAQPAPSQTAPPAANSGAVKPKPKVSPKKLAGTPSNLKKRAVTSSSVALVWDRVRGASGYEVFRSQSGGKYRLVKSTTAGSFKDTCLQPNTKYSYKVRAYKISKSTIYYSRYSKTLASVTAAAAPKKPSGLKVVALGAKSVAVSWKKVPGAKGYELQRSTNGKNFKTIKTLTGVKYTDTRVAAGNDYYYRVRAYTISDGRKLYSGYSYCF